MKKENNQKAITTKTEESCDRPLPINVSIQSMVRLTGRMALPGSGVLSEYCSSIITKNINA